MSCRRKASFSEGEPERTGDLWGTSVGDELSAMRQEDKSFLLSLLLFDLANTPLAKSNVKPEGALLCP